MISLTPRGCWFAIGAALLLGSAHALAQGAPSNAIAPDGGYRGTPEGGPGEAAAERRWAATIHLFSDFDSNIGMASEATSAAYDSAFRGGLAASGSYRLIEAGPWRAGVGAYVAQTGTGGEGAASRYDLTSLSAQGYLSAAFDVAGRPGVAQLAYQFRRDFLDGHDYEISHGLLASVSLRPFAFLETSLSYQVSFDTFDANGFHSAASARDADGHRIDLEATWLRLEAGQSFTLGYEYLRNQADEANYDFAGHGAIARFRTPLAAALPVQLELLAAYTAADYFDYVPAPRRAARTQYYRAALTLPLARHLVLDGSYGHTRIGADQARFRSRRHVVSVGVSYSF